MYDIDCLERHLKKLCLQLQKKVKVILDKCRKKVIVKLFNSKKKPKKKHINRT